MTVRSTSWFRTALLSGVFGLAACASPPPATSWHSLVSTQADPAQLAAADGVFKAEAAPPPAAATPASSLSVGAVLLPAEVDRPQLVLRLGDGRAVLANEERWLEPLKQQLPRALALGLSQRLGQAVSQAAVGPASSTRLTVEVQRFELRPNRSAVLRAVWTLQTSAVRSPPQLRVFDTTVPADAGVAGSVAAMQRAVDLLNDDIAAAVRASG